MLGSGTPTSFANLVDIILEILSLTVPLIFSLALLVIVWKVIDAWILHAGDPNKLNEGKQYVTWGIIILVVMSGIWTILYILRSSLFF